jgi:hypothetical protein
MENNVSKALNDFIEEDETTTVVPMNNSVKPKKVILDERSGLIERVDKIFVTSDGKQLLREQY